MTSSRSDLNDAERAYIERKLADVPPLSVEQQQTIRNAFADASLVPRTSG
jgi:hypothetical protein